MYSDLEKISNKLRKRIVVTSSKARIPHLGSCLSCLDLLVYLYWRVLKLDTDNPYSETRDRFLLSKGHGAHGLFQVLAERGYFPLSKCATMNKI